MDQASEPASAAGGRFARWFAPALAHNQLWRAVAGLIALHVIAMLWSWGEDLAVLQAGALSGMDDAQLAALYDDMYVGETAPGLFLLLLNFGGLWLGTWIVLRVLHDRRLATLFGPSGRLKLHEFAAGAMIAAGFYGFGFVGILFGMDSPFDPSGIEFGTWLMLLPPLAALTFLQAAGEEVVWRGYLTQQLAARFASPVAWWFVPSLLFGLTHFGYSYISLEFGIYYVCSTTLFGLAMTVTVVRTGGLAAAMGLHTGYNLIFSALAGYSDLGSAANLWVTPVETATDWLALVWEVGLLAFVASPLAPFPKETALFGAARRASR
jgi:membrane protease YdiL (CAAX protease family)